MARTATPEPRPRGEAVVRDVLDATLAEFARAGFAALRIEDVAERAGVAKTTIYRRWPTKALLVRAALDRTSGELWSAPETGDVRQDLRVIARHMVELVSSPLGRAILQVMATEGADETLRDTLRCLREDNTGVPLAVVDAAVARGELPPGTDADLVVNTLLGALHHRVVALHQVPDDAGLAALVDLVLDGARAR